MKVLVVDDNQLWCEMVATYLARDDHDVRSAFTLAEARGVLAVGPQVVILDQQLPDGEGLDLAQEILEQGLPTRILMVTGHPRIGDAVQALRLRIDDYLSKPVELEVVRHAVLRSAESLRLEQVDALHRRRTESDRSRLRLVGQGLQATRSLVERIGQSDCPVLITGETGSGKSLIAKAVHYVRGDERPFVKLNCAALPEGLVEAELFGVERGAFTGATASRTGLFELAHGGTLFLDEIGELSPAVQAKLLGVLEDGESRRVGGSKPRRFDVRIISATNRDLEQAMAEGAFRSDLFFRLDIGRLRVPPLRDRLGDLPALVDFLLQSFGVHPLALAPGEIERMAQYPWPGNVRELRNLLERSVLLHEPLALRPSSLLPAVSLPAVAVEAGNGSGSVERLDTLEKRHILAVLSHFDGHRQRTAEALGIGVSTLRRKLRSLRSE